MVPNRISENVKHIKLFKYSYIHILENSVLIFTYYGISNLMSPSWLLSKDKGFYMYKIISAILIFIIVVACFLRFNNHKIAGIYSLKRILIAMFLAIFPQQYYLLIIP